MAHWKEDPKPVPWLPVHQDSPPREPVAPSKPTVPARSPFISQPEPIDVDDDGADIIAPVTLPPPEEILPTDGRAVWDAVPVAANPASTPTAPVTDPIQSLGDAAVRRASLSASGAATPLGGVAPSVPSSHSAQAPVTDEFPVARSPYLAEAYQPKMDPALAGRAGTTGQVEAEGTETAPTETDLGDAQTNSSSASAPLPAETAPGFMDVKPPASAATPLQTATPELEEATPSTSELFSVPPAAQPSGGDSGEGDVPADANKRTPWWRSWPFLLLIGLLVMGAVVYAVVAVMSDADPEPVELTEPVIVPSPQEPTHEPISIEDPSTFQEALPQMVGLFALTGFESPEVSTLDLLEPAAEANLLTYQYEDVTLSVRAIQHFDTETALRHFDAIAVDGEDRTPVSAGAADVGERVNISTPDADTIVWRNNTALFFVTGPSEHLEEFFTNFPL